MATTSPHMQPGTAATFNSDKVKYGVRFKLHNGIEYSVSLVVGSTAFVRIAGRIDAARSMSRAYIAHQVKLGNFLICDQ